MDLAKWEADLDHIAHSKRYKGHLDLLIDGEKFFPAFIQSVQDAKKSVDVQVFIFDTDDYAVKLADLLKKRSSEVKVRVLMDDMGSLFSAQAEREMPFPPGFEPPDNIRTYLRAGSHVQVRASANPWLTVDHRKCMIIDNREAFVGGMNLGRQYRYEWHDMMVDLTGPIVGRLEKDYRLAWAHAGPFGDFGYAWELLFKGKLPRASTKSQTPLTCVRSIPARGTWKSIARNCGPSNGRRVIFTSRIRTLTMIRCFGL